MIKYGNIIQLKHNKMENEQDFYIPIPPIIEEPEFSEVSLIPEVVKRINSLKAPDDLKADFREIILSYMRKESNIDQISQLKRIVDEYLHILNKLKKSLKDKSRLFTYRSYSHFIMTENGSEVLEYFRETNSLYSQIYDVFIKQISKDERYQNFRVIAWKGASCDMWTIYITGTIVYSQKNKKIENELHQMCEELLSPKVIEEITSLKASDDLKDGFRKILGAYSKNRTCVQLEKLAFTKRIYLDILDKLKEAVDKNEKSFNFNFIPIYAYDDVDAIQQFKNRCLGAQIYDLFIEQLSKEEMYKNPKLTASKNDNDTNKWDIYMTCDIEYP